MIYPKNNLPTSERIDLGRKLFYDPDLSLDSSISCASCHHQKNAFADFRRISPGVAGRFADRNAPTLANVGFQPAFMFDGLLPTLEQQILVPIEEHTEMDFNIVEISKRLAKNEKYVQLSLKAYGQEPNPFVITRSIAAFERTFISNQSKYDAYRKGKKSLSKTEKAGEDLFFNQLNCHECHGGFNFTNHKTTNNGLIFSALDSGRMRVTKKESDRDVVKIPTLRNIALTAPYMHDGRFETLEQVIEHYKRGGDKAPNKDELIQAFELSTLEMKQLIAFLNTLTDKVFVKNQDFRKPKN
ncbi:MAG: c-type cytochrome [Bacteroidetes bacterium]|nr:c-type cytochrome [Bacteroidota bacterium]